MDFSALVFSVEQARRSARSALPDAPVRDSGRRWRRFRAVVSRLITRTRPRRAAGARKGP